jgi:replicative DNA helicase
MISREMTADAIGTKLVAGMAPIAATAAERGHWQDRDERGRFRYHPINDADITTMMAAQRAMRSRDLVIDTCPSGTLAAVRAAARRMKRRGGLDLVVLDYLGLMNVPELARVGNRVLEVTRLSADCKALAMSLDVPMLVLSQLNRSREGEADKRPTLASLRDSGSLEQDADCVMFLYREHYYLSREPPKRALKDSQEDFANRLSAWSAAVAEHKGRADVIFAKQRVGGPIGVKTLAYHEDNIWFSDLHDGGDEQ